METDEQFRNWLLEHFYGEVQGTDVVTATGADLDRIGAALGLQRATTDSYKQRMRAAPTLDDMNQTAKSVYQKFRSNVLSSMTAEEYLAQRKLLADSQAALRKSGYTKTAEEYDEYIAELDQQWVAQGGAGPIPAGPIHGQPIYGIGGVSGTTLTPTGPGPTVNIIPPPSPGKIYQVTFNGKTWSSTPLPSTDPGAATATFPKSENCVFCGSPTLGKHDRQPWSLCGRTQCQAAATAQVERMYAGLVDCEQTRKDALRWVERKEKK